jgi:hypothetical protein
VQSEKVMKPPLTRADSVGVNSRAPRRINTLFWSFMFFSFHHFGSVYGPKALQKGFAGQPTSGEEVPGLKMVAPERRHPVSKQARTRQWRHLRPCWGKSR